MATPTEIEQRTLDALRAELEAARRYKAGGQPPSPARISVIENEIERVLRGRRPKRTKPELETVTAQAGETTVGPRVKRSR